MKLTPSGPVPSALGHWAALDPAWDPWAALDWPGPHSLDFEVSLSLSDPLRALAQRPLPHGLMAQTLGRLWAESTGFRVT